MLGKLLKFDLKSTLRTFIPMWVLIIILSVINSFTINSNDGMIDDSLAAGLVFFALIILIVVVMVVAICLVIQRFYSSLVKDEGYLTFTLPVSTWQIVLSKGISAVLLILANAIVAVCAALIVSTGSGIWEATSVVWNAINFGDTMTLLLYILVLIVFIFQFCNMVFACISIGHMSSKFRVLIALAAYVIISIAFSYLEPVILGGVNDFVSVSLFNVSFSNSNGFVVDSSVGVSAVLLGYYAVRAAIFYFVTTFLLNRRLNLE